MTPIEIIALIVALFAAVKLLTILISPLSWLPAPKAVFSNPCITTVISAALGAIVLYYLLTELTIVQIFASMLFLAFLIVLSAAPYSKETTALANKIYKDKTFLKRAWFAMLIWAALIVWVLYALFA